MVETLRTRAFWNFKLPQSIDKCVSHSANIPKPQNEYDKTLNESLSDKSLGVLAGEHNPATSTRRSHLRRALDLRL